MDWNECIKKRIAKNVAEDKNLIKSTNEIAENKIRAANSLSDDLYYGKIILLYDALREILECMALGKGYKIYNHECYSSFLKEIIGLSREADIFDNLRKIRNGINYYGIKVSKDEANNIIGDLKQLILKFKSK
ncbi:hypothetical protein COS75_02820 [Candidatus Pacearchaeota archaeon CG06_land_8_20_14_3_00_35_12]|nr:MAG: hypothetical protein COS75_02820 [Candidatus Pacearchaeota archaeon CG06_land_8_20_14_3_00_35_12]